MSVYSRIKWIIWSNKIASIGSNSNVQTGFELVGCEYIHIGDDFSGGRNLRLHCYDSFRKVPTGFVPRLEIGNNVTITDQCFISCANSVKIEDGCLFGSNVFVTDNFHGNNSYEQMQIPVNERPLDVKKGIVIGKNVWLGRNVCVMPGVTIGDGAVIGANAVVTKDIPAYSVAVGVPARIVRSVHELSE